MGIIDIEPTNEEQDQFSFDEKSASKLKNLCDSETLVGKSLHDLAKRMHDATKDKEKYLDVQQQMVRQYIQLAGRDSKLVNDQDLQLLKQHISRIETTIEVQTEVQKEFKNIAGTYKEYAKMLEELHGVWGKITKKQKEWHKYTAELKKAKAKMPTGEKLMKLEKKMEKAKGEVIKLYGDKRNRGVFVENSFANVNDAWDKLKDEIKNVSW